MQRYLKELKVSSVANTSYSVGDKVKRTDGETVRGYVCKTANSDSSFTSDHWTYDNKGDYVEIVGNGTDTSHRSNARTLDWNGNETLAGGLTVGTTLSRGRKANETVGSNSIAFGTDVTASGYNSVAIGSGSTASGYTSFAVGTSTVASDAFAYAEGNQTISSNVASHSEGTRTEANGWSSHAEGCATISNGYQSHSEGMYTIANGGSSHVSGQYNVADSYDSWTEWVANTSYAVGDKVKVTTTSGNETNVTGYICRTANSDASFTSSHWDEATRMNYAEIVGNGANENNRANARALDWDGNEHLKGNLYVGCNADSSGGTRVPHDVQVNGTSVVTNGVATIPLAAGNDYGVVKVGNGLAIGSTGYLETQNASNAGIKAGISTTSVLTPSRQELSTFYGLSKVAGVDLANATVTAGTYPANSKAAIQTMLGVPSTTYTDNQVIISDTQPTATSNKLWIDSDDTGTEVTVPTYAELTTGLAGKVSDGQVNGTSVVTSGVANVPMASTSAFGAVKLNSWNGITIGSTDNTLMIRPAGDEMVKNGTNNAMPICSNQISRVAFYGLAKAAGADMASIASTTVGQYPDAQKIAIQKMLGIYEPPYTLVNEFTLQEDTRIILTVDSNGTPYNFRNVFIYVYYPDNTEVVSSGYARYRFYDLSDNNVTAETGRGSTSTSGSFKNIWLKRESNLTYVEYTSKENTGSSAYWRTKNFGNGLNLNMGNIVKIEFPSADSEPAGATIKVYAQWAY